MTSIIFLFLLVPILAFVLIGLNLLLAPHKPYKEKDSSFECGFHSFLGQNRSQFSISFFLFGLLFLVFDLEIVLIFPYAVSGYANGSYGLTLVFAFLVILTAGFCFEIGKKALSINSKQTNNVVSTQESAHNFNYDSITYYYIKNHSNLINHVEIKRNYSSTLSIVISFKGQGHEATSVRPSPRVRGDGQDALRASLPEKRLQLEWKPNNKREFSTCLPLFCHDNHLEFDPLNDDSCDNNTSFMDNDHINESRREVVRVVSNGKWNESLSREIVIDNHDYIEISDYQNLVNNKIKLLNEELRQNAHSYMKLDKNYRNISTIDHLSTEIDSKQRKLSDLSLLIDIKIDHMVVIVDKLVFIRDNVTNLDVMKLFFQDEQRVSPSGSIAFYSIIIYNLVIVLSVMGLALHDINNF